MTDGVLELDYGDEISSKNTASMKMDCDSGDRIHNWRCLLEESSREDN